MTVAAARKQQKEVDIVLKKVEDGMEEFAHVWDQGTRALGGSSAQKEKLGEELKKSINKLQRLRVQIREWIQQSDMKGGIKDKLEEARRKIESDMTRFKEFERELKTKAFSSNALAKGDELDEADAERLRWQEWLSSTIQQLNDQREEFEADLEALSNKKNLSERDKERMPELREWQDRHEFHIQKMELILRALDNEALDLSDLACMREGVEFYMESHMEPNFMHDEGLYDYIDLSSFEEEKTKARTPSIDLPKETPAPKDEKPAKGKDKERKKKDDKKDKKEEEKKAVTPTPAGKAIAEAVITKGKEAVVAATAKDLKDVQTAAGGADAKAVAEQKKPAVVRSIVDDLAEDECKVQADQLMGDAEEFICKICQVHVVGCSPKLTNCSHLFCGDCLAQWFAQHPESQTWAQRARSAGPERVVPCPVCKQPLNEKKDLYPVCGATSRSENLLLWRMLSSLKIVCMNSCQLRKKDGRCDWVGEYGQYQKHAKACQNLPMAESGEVAPAAAESIRETQAPTVSRSPVGAAPQHGTPVVSRPEVAPSTVVQPATSAPTVQPSLGALPPARSQEPTAAPTPVGAPPRSAAPTVVAPRVQRSPNPAPPQPPQPVKLQTAQSTTPSTSVPSSQSTDTSSSPVAAEAKPATGTSTSGAAAAAKAPDASATSSTAEEGRGSDLVATCAFEPTGPNMLQVRPGDLIQVLERHASGWAFCKNVTSSAASGSADVQGWAPSWIAQPLQGNEDKSASQASQAQHSRAKEPETRQAAVAAAPTPQHSQGGATASQGAATTPAAPSAAATASSAAKAPSQQQQQLQQQQQSLRPAATAASPAAESASAPASTQAAAPAAAPKAPQSVLRAAVAPFGAATASQLSLAVGDLVEIVERDSSGWTYGRKAQDGSRQGQAEGWFPDWCTQK